MAGKGTEAQRASRSRAPKGGQLRAQRHGMPVPLPKQYLWPPRTWSLQQLVLIKTPPCSPPGRVATGGGRGSWQWHCCGRPRPACAAATGRAGCLPLRRSRSAILELSMTIQVNVSNCTAACRPGTQCQHPPGGPQGRLSEAAAAPGGSTRLAAGRRAPAL